MQKLFIIVSIIASAAIVSGALFDPYSFTGNYIANGTIFTTTQIGPTFCNASTIVFDSNNQRIYIDIGTGGQYWMFPNSAYIANLPQFPNNCSVVSNYNYTTQVVNYQNAKLVGEVAFIERYFGLILDIGSCNERLGSIFSTLFGKLVKWDFEQPYPVGETCLDSRGVIEYTKFDFTSSRNKYFEAPIFPASQCIGSTIDFCNTVYPPGNACENF